MAEPVNVAIDPASTSISGSFAALLDAFRQVGAGFTDSAVRFREGAASLRTLTITMPEVETSIKISGE